MNYLFVVAHPDDEVLGAGGTICKLVEEGHKVGVCILSCVCKTREDEDLIEKIKESHKILGVHKTYFGEFECISINKAPHYEVVEYIEKSMIDFNAQVIFTHHPNDTNIDHYTVSEIVGEASRLSHRQLKDVKISPLQAVYYMEIPSSTDWSFNAICKKFEPNTFVSIIYENIDKKIKALEVYDNVIREMPHPRSVQALIARSYVRGSECGSDTGYAEAFECVYRVGV